MNQFIWGDSMTCFDKFMKIREDLNEHGYSSYDDYDMLKETGKLDELLEDAMSTFECYTIFFLDIFKNAYYKNKPAYRKQALYQAEFIRIYDYFGYMISLYCDNKEAYRVFPQFVLELCKKFNIPNFKDMTFEEMYELLNDNIDLSKHYDYKYKRDLIEILPRIPSDKYTKYDMNKTIPNYDDKDDFSIFAEVDTFKEECSKLLDKERSIVNLTAAYLGDGFGYDVYSYDPDSDREKLIEVKSGRYPRVELTLNEFKTLYKTKNQPKTDYYIYRYFYDGDKLHVFKLKYEKDEDVLIDQYNNRYILNPKMEFDSEHRINPLITFSLERIVDYSDGKMLIK